MSHIAGVILAGGRGERLGHVVKANLIIGGRTLLERVAGSLASPSPILVAYGAVPPEELALPLNSILIPDLASDYAGPLAGLAGAVAWARQQAAPPQILILAPVDTPFLPPDYVDRLTAPLKTSSAAVASFDGQPYPTSSAWRLAAIDHLADDVLAGTAPRSLKRLADRLGAMHVPFPPHAGGDPFANANTPAELLELQRRADV